MSWQGIRGHDSVVEQFRRGLEQGRLASTFLFVGPEGIGKRSFASKLAQAMLCTTNREADLTPCGTCPACHQVISNTHPDLQVVRKPEDRAFIPVETFIGERDERMRTGLCRFISLTPTGGKRRIAIVDDADWLNQEGANSLLKTLEEPSPGSIIILISTSLQRQLPTIRSRSQVVRFRTLTKEDVAACLLENDLAENQQQATQMAARADGSVARAIALADESIVDFRQELWKLLAQSALNRAAVTKCVNEFSESAGKDTPSKRAQLRIAFQTAMEFYRALARSGSGCSAADDQQLRETVALVGRDNTVEVAVEQVDRCLDAVRQVNANANLGILVDAWVSDLATMTRTHSAKAS